MVSFRSLGRDLRGEQIILERISHVRPERYRGGAPKALEPVARRQRLLNHIAAMSADVLCLQEIEPDLFEASQVRLSDFDGCRRKLDYLLYRSEQLHPSPGTMTTLYQDTPLPTMSEPSDHLPVLVRYTPA